MVANYREIAKQLNEDYQRVSSASWANQVFDRDRALTDILDTALDITGNDSFSVSQVGNYQFWRDRDAVAVVDTLTDRLVVYGDNRDIIPTVVSPKNLPSIHDPSNLMAKVMRQNPYLIVETTEMSIRSAHDFIKHLDPSERAKFLQNYSGEDRVVSFLSKTNNTLDSTVANILKFREKPQEIALDISGNKLMRELRIKFERAWQKTEENNYVIGDYLISKIDNNHFQLRDNDDNLIFSYSKSSDRHVVSDSTEDLEKLNRVRAQIKIAEAKGESKALLDRENQISELIQDLAKYQNGKHRFKNSDLRLERKDNRVTLKSGSGEKLIHIDSDRQISDITLAQIREVKVAIEMEKSQGKVDDRVEKSAAVIAEYLKLSGTNRVEKEKSICEYNPVSQIISYEDKQDGNNYFQAKKTSGGWKNIAEKSSLTEEKADYFQQVLRSIEQRQQRQQQHQKKTRKLTP